MKFHWWTIPLTILAVLILYAMAMPPVYWTVLGLIIILTIVFSVKSGKKGDVDDKRI